MNNFIKTGTTLTYTAGATIASGAGLLLGTDGLFGVNAYDVVSGDSGEAQIEGVFSLPKKTTDTPAAFSPAYWDDSEDEVTTTSTDNTLIGFFTAAYGSGTTSANVRLTPIDA